MPEQFVKPKVARRRLLRNATGIAAKGAAALMDPKVRRMLAQDAPKNNSLSQIKHVVILMQENRSIDHYFKTPAGVRGFDDPDAFGSAVMISANDCSSVLASSLLLPPFSSISPTWWRGLRE